jgi:hypothetical protein
MPDTFHSQQTGASAVHPASFTQSSDPGAVGANKLWIDTTTSARVLKQRNTANTAWVTVQNALTTLGDIEYATTAGARTKLPIGAEGQSLTVSLGVPVWGSSSGAAIYLARTMY